MSGENNSSAGGRRPNKPSFDRLLLGMQATGTEPPTLCTVGTLCLCAWTNKQRCWESHSVQLSRVRQTSPRLVPQSRTTLSFSPLLAGLVPGESPMEGR